MDRFMHATPGMRNSKFAVFAALALILSFAFACKKNENYTSTDTSTTTAQTDHSKAGDELKQWASTKGLDLPTQPNADQQKTATDLTAKSGAAFDKAYMEDMVKDHDKDVKEFQDASKKVKDPDLKAWIDKT